MQSATPYDAQDIFFRKVLGQVEQRGLDCRAFRPSYIVRRLAGRLRVTGCDSYFSYHRYLERHPQEYPLLLKALTVNVTEFFRDEGVFKELETNIFPTLIAGSAERGRSSIRIWSAGCASGEEVFSVAMIMAQCLAEAAVNLSCSIYGTDVDESSVEKGRAALYPIGGLATIPNRYRKFVVRAGPSEFSFTPEIHRMVRFKKMDLFTDKPIKPAEVILCRNVMIYFNRQQQKQLVEWFYRSMVPRGYLIIGKSEKLQYDRHILAPINTGCRIYQKVG